MKNRSLFLYFGVLVLVLTLLYGGLRFWQNSGLDAKISQSKADLIALTGELNGLEKENVFGVIAAKKILNEISASSIKWSELIKTIDSTIPKISGDKIVEILSYSGSFGDDLALSVSTIGGAKDPYGAVADFIEAFDSSESFEGNFVPSIASGVNAVGESVLTFSFNTKFKPAAPDFGNAPVVR